jgi:hypothetical protein
MSRALIIAGIILILAGLSWNILKTLPLGRLPGDIVVHKRNFTLYVPIATSLLLSLAASVILWLLSRR